MPRPRDLFGALLPEELSVIEEWVRKQTGVGRLWHDASPGSRLVDHNSAQLVGATRVIGSWTDRRK